MVETCIYCVFSLFCLLLQNLPLNEGVTEAWIQSAIKSVDQQISAAGDEIKKLKDKVDAAKVCRI